MAPTTKLDHCGLDLRRAGAETDARATPHRTGAHVMGRRAFLRAGTLVLPLPFLEVFRGTAVAAPVAPRFYLAWHQGQGTQWNEFAIPGTSETDFRLGKILEPIAAYKDRLLVIRGVDNKAKGRSSGNGHESSYTTCMTCQPNGGGPSFDQVLSQKIRKPGQRASLNLGAGPSARQRFYAGAGDKIESQGDPRKVLASLFAGSTPSAGPDLAKLQARRKSVLDIVRGNMATFRARLGREDKDRLDQHSDKLRELEIRLGQQSAAATCGSPKLTLPTSFNPGSDHAASAEAQIEIVAMAFACGLTPVATIEFTDDHDPGVFRTFTSGHTDWHAMVHTGESKRNIAGLIAGYRWYAERFAKLLDRFAAVKTETGSLLDCTTIQWTADFGYGAGHNGNSVQVALAGSLGPNVKMGRMLSFTNPESLFAGSTVALNNVFVSVLQAFGKNEDAFGSMTGVKPGPVPGVG